MNALIVCDSRAYGNTRKVAEAMADALGAEVVTPHEARRIELANYDIAGFGSGIYAMNFYADLRQLVEALPKVGNKRAFIFLTSASSEPRMRKPVAKMTATLTNRGYEVVGHFWCRGFWNPWWLRLIGGVNKGHPDRADLDAAGAFARNQIDQTSPEALAETQPVSRSSSR